VIATSACERYGWVAGIVFVIALVAESAVGATIGLLVIVVVSSVILLGRENSVSDIAG
jgi:hypothetical protein